MRLICYATLITLLSYLFFIPSLNAQPTFVVHQDAATSNDATEVCFDIYADNFTNLIGFGFPVTWDSDVLQFKEIRNINLSGLSRDDFDLSEANRGRYTVNWNALDNFPTSINNGFVLYKACFTPTPRCGANTIMGIDTTGLDEGRNAYANIAFSLGDELVGINVGFYKQDAAFVIPCPCDLEAQIVATTPTPSNEGVIDLCLGESLDVVGEARFQAGFEPTNGLKYTWNFGNGTTSHEATTSYQYTQSGIYTLSLEVADTLTNCASTNSNQLKIRVAAAPTVELIDDRSFCPNELITLNSTNVRIAAGVASGLSVMPNDSSMIADAFRADSLFLPDGEGVAYQSQLSLNAFPAGATIQQASDIAAICLNMEHSWARDLNISLICPNGNRIKLHNFVGQTGNRIRLGTPNEGDESNPIAGLGAQYCWTSDATNPTWLEYSDLNAPNSPLSLPAGNYQPVGNFEDLIGCPLNGTWTLEVEDLWALDNGFIFNWGILFNPDLIPEVETFTVPIADFAWQNHPDAQTISANTITLSPSQTGLLAVPYIITDAMGCVYEDVLHINIDGTLDCDCETLPKLVIPSTPRCSNTGQTYAVRVNTEAGNTITSSSGIIAGSSGFLTVYNIPAGQEVTITITNAEGCNRSQTVAAPNCGGGCPEIAAPQLNINTVVLCEGENLPTISVQSQGLTTTTQIRWYAVESGGTTIATGNAFTPSQAGDYYAAFFDTANACTSPRTLARVAVLDAPNATISGNLQVCAGERTTLTASGGATYAWNNFARSNKVGVKAGIYAVTVTDTNGCQDVATVTVVEINGPPCIECPFKAAPQSTGNRQACSSEAIPALSVTGAGVNSTSEIRWYNNATGGAVLARGFSFTPNAAGTYYAEIFDTSNNCPSPRRAITLTIINCIGTAGSALSIRNTNSTNQAFELLQAQPNPFQDETKIRFELLQEDSVELILYDVAGRIIYQQTAYYTTGIQDWTIAAKQLTGSGLYFYRLQTTTHSVLGKLVLEK